MRLLLDCGRHLPRIAPFVCIEPWYGRCDKAHYTGEYKDKDWVQHLQPEEVFKGKYTIEIEE